MSIDRQPVTTAEELATLDPVEIYEGYMDGLKDEPAPGGNRSKSYWHGWRNAQNDRNRTSDKAQRDLARAVKVVRVA